MRTRQFSLPSSAVLLFLVFGALGCNKPSAVEPTPGGAKAGPTFTFAQASEPRTLDPGLITDTYGSLFAQNLFEGLLVWDQAGARTLPGAAERHEVSADGRTWTFHLRRDAIWSNGDPVTATDFLVAWRRVLNPQFGSDYASLLFPIAGAQALADGEEVDASTLGVDVQDRFTLVVTLANPTPWFDAIVAHHVASPVNSNALKRHGHGWWQPGNIVVNGPFTLEAWDAGRQLVLRRNSYYHSVDQLHLDRVVARFIKDPAEVLRQYDAGEVDWTGSAGHLPAGRLGELAARPEAHSSAELGTAWLWLNTERAPTDDVRVRQALALSLDRASIAKALAPGDAATGRLVPEGMPGYPPPEIREPDLAVARALLVEAGFPEGAGAPAIELAVDGRPVHEALAKVVAERWTEVLGLQVTIYSRDYSAHADAIRSGEFQVGRGGWVGDYPDPSSFLSLLTSENALNASNWSDTGFDALVREAERTEDGASRLRLLAQAERLALEQAPLLPLYQFGSLSLLKPWVTGFTDNPLQVHLLRYIRIAGSGPSMTSGT